MHYCLKENMVNKWQQLIREDIIFLGIVVMLFYVSTMHILVDFGITENIKFVTDAVILFLLITFICKKKWNFKEIGYFAILCFAWIVYLIVRTCMGVFDTVNILFSSRNWFRGLLMFYFCVCTIKKEQIKKIYNLIKVLYVVDFSVSLIKFIFLNIKWDDLSGIFWDNGATNVFLCISLIVVLVEYCSKTDNIVFFSFVCLSSMITSALSEIKVYFFEFWLIILLSIFLLCIQNIRHKERIELKKIIYVIIFSFVSFVVGLWIMATIYPDTMTILSSIAGYNWYEETSRTAYLISRSKAFSEINDMFFFDSAKYNLFGFGFGTTFAINTHLFYACHQKLYFEGGIINYLLFNAIIIGIGIKNFVVIIKGKYDTVYNKISLVMAIICVILTIYDSSMYKEISYVIYFVLACGDISTKESLEKDLINE